MSAPTLPEAAHTLLTALFPDALMTEPLRINLRGLIYKAPKETAVSEFAPSVTALHSAAYANTLLAWNRDQDRSIYVASGLRRGRDGKKRGVAGITAFWADQDAKDFLHLDGLLSPAQRVEGKRLAWTRLRAQLPAPLQPSLVIDTGGGLQSWWLLKEAAWLDDYPIETLEGYLEGLARALNGDPAVTHLAALMRLPGFANRKYPDDPIATIVTADLTRRFNPRDFADYWINIPTAEPRTDDAASTLLGPLAPVLDTCGFLQWCRDHPADVREPLWYSMLSNLVRLEGGREAAHAFSRGHPGYSPAETDAKLDQAFAAPGPTGCQKIQKLGFRGCPAEGHGVHAPAWLAWPEKERRDREPVHADDEAPPMTDDAPEPGPASDPEDEAPRPTTLEDVHVLFRQHYGQRYDTGALDAVIAAAATTFLSGDPVWLLVIGGSGGLKTETVTAARLMPGATATSTITSVGALLSGTAHPQRARDATGGLLRRVGNPGLLLIKDVSSILSMNRDARALVLAALREVYDGSWIREVGTDGGRTIRWQGRLIVIGAVTTAWDHAHAVVSSMGDRFMLVRLDTNDPDRRQEAGARAMDNVGHEGEIRQDVAEAVAALLRTAAVGEPPLLSRADEGQLLAMADFVTRSRTGVETDYRGDIIQAHALEMPTRFLKQLVQLVRGGHRVGLPAERALALALRCAVDSIPPLRLHVGLDLLAQGQSKAGEVAARLGEDVHTITRVLGALTSLRIVHREIVSEPSPFKGRDMDVSYYTLRPQHQAIFTRIAGLLRCGFVGGGREGEDKVNARARERARETEETEKEEAGRLSALANNPAAVNPADRPPADTALDEPEFLDDARE